MTVDYLRFTRKIYCLVGIIASDGTRAGWRRRLISFFVITSMLAFNMHAFFNGCFLAGLTKDCISQTIVFIVVHTQSSFKLAVLLLERGGNMVDVLQFVDGHVFVNKSYSKHIYVCSFSVIVFTVLAYAVYPLVWYRLPFFYETVWGSESVLAFFTSYLVVFADLYLIFLISVLNDFTFLLCADAICSRLSNVKSWLESIEGVQDEKKLIHVIKEHQAILRILNFLADVISPNFFSQMFASVSIVIFSAFSAMKTDPQHFSAVLSSFCNLLLYCWLGQMVKDATEDLHFASYNNQWYNCNKDMKMNLEIISLYTRKPFEIKGGSIVKMNLPTFKEAVADSYSYLMLLITMMDE